MGVSGGLALDEKRGRRSAERRTLSVETAACFPDRREIEATATPFDAPSRRLKTPGPRFRGLGRPKPRRFRRLPVPVQPTPVADPVMGRTVTQGLPSAWGTPPTPAGAAPTSRSKRPRNAPLT